MSTLNAFGENWVCTTLMHEQVLVCRTLGALAEKCHAYAKALHYKELEFKTSPESCVEALISINNQLRQPEAAIGILTYAQQTLHMELKASILAMKKVLSTSEL